jgi:hypothetical protein
LNLVIIDIIIALRRMIIASNPGYFAIRLTHAVIYYYRLNLGDIDIIITLTRRNL